MKGMLMCFQGEEGCCPRVPGLRGQKGASTADHILGCGLVTSQDISAGGQTVG